MPKFIIERDMPGVGNLGGKELQGAAKKSCEVLYGLGPDIQWKESFVTGDKLYCVYQAPNEELIKEHAEKAGFPASSISQVMAVIDPATAE